ncbi:MAG: 3-deoxy-7-phosphoheptulonate synthase [Christensenellaceae bacterium]|jgi:3-deoxy-7-phosphoheptulonate synthase|nr:3-deoxy-7-phosphoheptulonate synthase [Christensenellaceae bacterium]
MILVIKNDSQTRQLDNLISWIKSLGLNVHLSHGENCTIMGIIGDTSLLDIDLINSLDIVETVKRISEPYKKSNRKFHPQDTIIEVDQAKFGGKNFAVIAGPCSVESEEQIISIARDVKAAGATALRGGAFKPRTSPYAFQGLRADGIRLLLLAKKECGLPIVTEIMSVTHLDMFSDVDIIQIGARNMQNFELLKEVGRLNKPILLKRGLANTMEEWIMSAEYIMAEGNSRVILCERGIRTFEHYTRNTLDLSAIPLVKEFTHLPVIVDPSHASGLSRLVRPLSLASAGVGSDGLIIEVHNNPEKALCDGPQCIRPAQFADIMNRIKVILPLVGKECSF